MEEPTDHRLLELWLDTGSQSAFEALVIRYGGMVQAVALRTGDALTAEEAVQETFITLARKAPLLRNRTSLAGWLHLTAIHKIRNLRRKRQAESNKLRTFDQQTNLRASPNASTEDAWAALKPELDGALSRLGEKDRGMILLRFYRDLSITEIAEALEIETKAAQKRLSRALERLRSGMQRRGCALKTPLAATLAAGFAGDATASVSHISRIVASATAPARPFASMLFITLIMKVKSSISLAIVLILLIISGSIAFSVRKPAADASSADLKAVASGSSPTASGGIGDTTRRPKRPVVNSSDTDSALVATYGEEKVKAASKSSAATLAALEAMRQFQLHVPAVDRDIVASRSPYKDCNISSEQADKITEIENGARQKAAALYDAKVAEIQKHSKELTELILASDQCATGILSQSQYDQALAAASGPVRDSLSNVMRSPLLFAIDDEMSALKKEQIRNVLAPDQWPAYEREIAAPLEMSYSVPPPAQKLDVRLQEMEAMRAILEATIKGATAR
ncbi:MAG: sigma-70 family RNA polymerase sigma factor [Luteolibacter sp.]|uniref:RNA polymerase sigma factor n=1 Tax=Luteolibacter sp. TaxID=1962973 RepID=UPI003267CACE